MLVVGVLSSCSTASSQPAQTPTSLAFSLPETTLIAEPQGIELDANDARLVEFHAKWVCELQRRTFQESSGGVQALAEALEEAEIGEANYSEFLKRLEDSQDLRDVVLYSYQESCRG